MSNLTTQDILTVGMVLKNPNHPDIIRRFREKTFMLPVGCWHWRGRKNMAGYGTIRFGRRKQDREIKAHRLSYLIYKGDIPSDYDVHHVCQNPSCVNPAHLEALAPVVHCKKSLKTLAFINSQKTHCPSGHPYSGDNLVLAKLVGYPHRRQRICRICRNNSVKRSRSRTAKCR